MTRVAALFLLACACSSKTKAKPAADAQSVAVAKPATPGIRTVVVEGVDWNAALPAEWRPEAPDQAELRADVGDGTLFTVGGALYQGNTAPSALPTMVTREIHGRRVRLVDRKTGIVIADDAVLGAPPRDLRAIESGSVVAGADVTPDDLKTWLEPFVTGKPQPAVMIGRTTAENGPIVVTRDGTRMVGGDNITSLPSLAPGHVFELHEKSSGDHQVVPVPAIDQSGTLLALAGDRERIALFNLGDNTETGELKFDGGMYHAAADGLCIANDHVLLHPREAHEWQVISIATGKKVAKFLSSHSDCVVSPRTPLAALLNDALVDLVDTRTWKLQSLHFAVGDKVGAVAWSPDGTSFVVGYASGVIQRYPADLAALKKDKLDKPHPTRAPVAKLANSISGLAFTADGKQLIAADVDGIHLLDAATGTEVARLSRLPGVRDLTALPDGAHVLGTAADIGYVRWAFILRLAPPAGG